MADCPPLGASAVKAFVAMLRCQSGASAAEYALILAIVGTGIIVAAIYLGEVISGSMSDTAGCISSDGAAC